MSEPPIGVSTLGRRGHFIIAHHHFLDHEHGHEQKHARRHERSARLHQLVGGACKLCKPRTVGVEILVEGSLLPDYQLLMTND